MDSKNTINSSDETIIELSKTKIVRLLLGASAFVALGIWMFSMDSASIQSQRHLNNPVFVHGLGLSSIIFFGFFGLLALKKLFDKKPGLAFNSSGITDYTSGVSAGFIPWADVVGAEIYKVQNQKLLIIIVRDPQEYIGRGSSLKQALNKANYKFAGSSVSISSNTLKINFSELVSIFEEYQRRYGVAPCSADVRDPLFEREEPSAEVPEDIAGNYRDSINRNAAPEVHLLNWSPVAVRGTVGSGGIGILVLSLSSLDMLFRIKVPFWPSFVAALLPMFIFFVAVPDFFPRKAVRPAQSFAVVWYLLFAALSISLAAFRGFAPVDLLLAGFIILGAWPCIVAIRKIRVVKAA